ncbi:hypothetical protein [Aeromonas salmonicida]
MKFIFQFFILLMFAHPAFSGDLERPEIKHAEMIAKKIGTAIFSGDYEFVISNMHPTPVQLMGGRDKAIEMTRAAFADIKEQGMELSEYLVKPAAKAVYSGKFIYVVFPTILTLESKKVRTVGDGYILAYSDDQGKNWSFADGAGLKNPEVAAIVFPELPAELSLPIIPPPSVEMLP